MSDLPIPCANCGRPVKPSEGIWTRRDEDGEPCCCRECYDQHEDEGCPMEHGGYRDNPKLLAELSALEARCAGLERERDALQADLDALRAHLNCGLKCSCRDCTLNGSEHPCKCEQKYCEELDNSQDKLAAAVEALRELHALVLGECPSLLNEDSGGCSRLDMEIDAILAGHAPATPMPTEKQKAAMHYGSIGAISLGYSPATKREGDE